MGADSSLPDRVVGIGASAGGLEALQTLVGPLEPGHGCAFVVVQHLAPTHASLMVELVSGSTRLRVVEAVDGGEILPDVILIGPPNCDLTVENGRLRLTEPAERFSPAPSIDVFFESLADQWHERAVAVVLSGTGSDGATGMRAVKGLGGITMVQEPETARFDSMPRAAISLGGAELVAAPAVLGERLNALEQFAGEHPLSDAAASALSQITEELKRSIGVDFSDYKEATVRRQIQRRMAVCQVDDLYAYLERVAADPDEAHALAGNLLVTVTSFFRGEQSFEALRAAITPITQTHESLRVWVPGCASGEEAFSIAMLIGEAMGFPADLDRRLKIFATDLDEVSLAIGRRAIFPPSALAQIPERFHDRYLRSVEGGVQMAEVLRECVVFARHDVSRDAPFSRLDLISCRNTFIYFTQALQQRVLGYFAFGLNPGGLLFLGESENIDTSSAFFHAVDESARIFSRTAELIGPVGPFAPLREWPPEQQAPIPTLGRQVQERQIALLEALVRASGEAYLVLDEAQNLVRVVGDVTDYCQVPEGRITATGGSFLRPELRDDARALLLIARTGDGSASGRRIHLDVPDVTVQMHARRIGVDGMTFTVLVFRPVSEPEHGEDIATLGGDARLERLERELNASQDTLRRSLNELQVTNEELEASSEELQAASEELQASNEELQASNEELQAANQELATLNVELSKRSEDYQRINTDLENIQASSSQGMVIVDHDLRVTRFTPLAVRVFALVDSDVGQPLLGVPTTLRTPGLEAVLRSVVAGEERQSIRVGDAEVSYLIQVLPYRALDGRSLGAIVTLTDVTELDQLRKTAEHALAELRAKSDQLEHRAAHDFTTGLLNREYLTEIVEREMARVDRDGERLALAWVDIDRFKETNDEFGHDAGDEVLRVIGERLLRAVRAGDYVGRIGGDEFGVVVTGYHHLAELDAILDRLVVSMRAPIDVDGQEARVAGSVGVALYPDDAQTPDSLMQAADTAMYAVKHHDGDAYGYFSPTMQAVATQRRQMRGEIARALEQNDFEMHYQPIVDASTDEVVAVESLVRWHRDRTLVPAADFVPFCEKSGQIRALGLTTLGLLRRDTEQLRDAGYSDLLVSFNMTVTQLEDPRLIQLVDTWPMPAGLGGIIVEVVESIFLPDHRVAMSTTQKLTDLGAQTAVDDYGAGYSNARLLEAFSPSFIKLDSSFLSESHTPATRAALIKSAVEVAHVLGSKVVAEAVETDEQREMVRQCGVNYVQGYGIGRPMSLSDLLEWLDDGGPARAAHG